MNITAVATTRLFRIARGTSRTSLETMLRAALLVALRDFPREDVLVGLHIRRVGEPRRRKREQVHLGQNAADDDQHEGREPEEGQQQRSRVNDEPAQRRPLAHCRSSTNAPLGMARSSTRIIASEPRAMITASAEPAPKSSFLKLSTQVK